MVTVLSKEYIPKPRILLAFYIQMDQVYIWLDQEKSGKHRRIKNSTLSNDVLFRSVGEAGVVSVLSIFQHLKPTISRSKQSCSQLRLCPLKKKIVY